MSFEQFFITKNPHPYLTSITIRPKYTRLIALRVSNLIPITLPSLKPSRFRDIFDNLLSEYNSLRKKKPPCAEAVIFLPPAITPI